MLGASWKTTVAGIGTICAGLGNALLEFGQGGVAAVNWTVLVSAITAGIGLILAKDSNVTGGTVQALPPAK